MRSLNIDQLRALETVAELASFTAAAKRLNLSQSAVSTQIRELETRFGLRLLDRLGKRAYATPAGQEVIAHTQRIRAELAAIDAAMRRRRDGWLGSVRIGVPPNIMITPILKYLRDKHPNIELSIRAAISPDIVADVRDNRLDLAIATTPFDERGLSMVPLREDEFFVVLPKSDKKAPREFTPEAFAGRFYILDGRSQIDKTVREWLAAAGIEPKPAMQTENIDAVMSVVASGIGISVLPQAVIAASAYAKDVIRRSFKPPLRRSVFIVQRRDKPADPALDIVREAVLKFLKVPAAKHKGRTARR